MVLNPELLQGRVLLPGIDGMQVRWEGAPSPLRQVVLQVAIHVACGVILVSPLAGAPSAEADPHSAQPAHIEAVVGPGPITWDPPYRQTVQLEFGVLTRAASIADEISTPAPIDAPTTPAATANDPAQPSPSCARPPFLAICLLQLLTPHESFKALAAEFQAQFEQDLQTAGLFCARLRYLIAVLNKIAPPLTKYVMRWNLATAIYHLIQLLF